MSASNKPPVLRSSPHASSQDTRAASMPSVVESDVEAARTSFTPAGAAMAAVVAKLRAPQ